MSSKKFVYLLMVAIVFGFMTSGAVYGQSTGALTFQSTGALTFKGKVLNADGTPAPGYTISGETVPVNSAYTFIDNPSNTDGSYSLAVLGFSIGGPPLKINVGDRIKITATDADGNDTSVIHTVTVDNVASTIVASLNIVLSGLTVQADPPSIPADGSTRSTITVTVREGSEGVTGDTITLSADKGAVDATATEVGNGVYTATYTAPSLVLIGPETANISVSSTATELDDRVSILLTPVPITVTVDVDPYTFMADTPGKGAVTVTVDHAGPVTDAAVELALNPEVGALSEVTDNGDGTYSATYTSGSTAGNVTLTATAPGVTVPGRAIITINAGPPAEIALSAAPGTVSSLGSSTITAMVTDSNGNAAGATLTASTTSFGTVGEFASTVFGTYTATYSAPMVEIDIQMTETITVSTDGVSRDLTLNLIGEDPIDVAVLTIEGRVYKEDGEIPAAGVEITVMVGSTPQTTTTDADGYMVLFIRDLITPVATTGDIVSIAVADANVVALNVNGTEQPGSSFRLINDILEKVQAAEPVTVDVTTDIVIPPRTVNALVVEGMVSKEDGTTPAGGVEITVTVGSDSQMVTTETDGSYEVLFIGDLITSVATTGDMISVEVRDGSGVRGTNPPPPEEATLSNLELGTTGSATVRRDVKTDIGLTSSVLAVAGTVYLKNGDTDHVAASNNLREGDLKVVVTNTTRDLSRETTVGDDGTYELLIVGDNFATVAETGDEILVEVQNDAGVIVGSEPHTLTIDDIKATRADINVETDVRARVLALVIEGNVIELDGSSAGPGVEVTLTIVMNGTSTEGRVVTDAAGSYRYLFASTSPEAPAARTDDILRVQVLRAATRYFGYREMELRSHELAYQNQPLVVLPPIQLIPPTLRLGGLSINTSYADQYYGYLSLEAIKKNPELLQLIPSGILHLDLSQNLLASLPSGFNPTPEPTVDITQMFDIDSENFGNGITPRPAWHVLAGSSPPDPGRWLNGNQLSLYVVTGPIPSVQSVAFTLTGPQGETREAMPVPADGYMHTFQLEEERAILFLPSWSSLNANAPIFSGVTLRIDRQAPISMTSKLVGDEVVWEAPATLTANSTVYYYYQVELDQPYQLDDEIVSSWPMPDPRNLQVENRGIVETLLAPDVPELMEIVTTTDLKLRSVFNVPGTGEYESLWVATFDFPAGADGAYSVDTVVQYDGGLVRNIPNQMFTLDRTPPTADITVAFGESAGLYEGPDGSYVTAAHTDEGTLNLTAMPTAAPSESAAYLYQIIQLDDAGNPGNHVWNPAMVTGEMLPLTYMDPHQIQASIGDVGTYGIRAVGIDSILNISSNTMPRRLNIVPPDPDIAAVTLVHADYFEMEQRVSDGVTIFPDRSNIMLTVEMIERTDHPLKSIAIDFQINGEGGWKPIAMLTGDDIAEVASGLEVNWDRTDDFADLLDMRGQAMVRVTVTNALDVEGESTATFEIVPLTLRLGGLSIDTSHADDYYGYLSLEAIKKNPELLQLIPSGILHLDLSQNLLSELPPGFNPTPEPTDDITQMFDIDQKNFGNGITPRPAWHVLAGSSPPDPGRWLNGNQLNLYVVTVPTSSIQNVTFNLTGPQSATMEAVSVPADGYMHNFQLEEERAILFLPSWPSLNANTPIFSGVTLMIDGQDPIFMTSKLVGDEVVWEAPATLTANSTVYYYYQVELDQPYQLDDEIVSSWPMPDPRNLQVENRGIVETLLAPDVLELKEIVTTTDLKLRSVFNVPGIGEYESLWVAAFDFPADADGAYSVDTVVQYMGGPIRSIPNQMFTLDRTPPTADITVAIGESAGLYEGPDGYVTAAHTDEGTLNLTAMPTAAPSESAAYLYQIIQLDDAGNPGNHVWNPAMVTGEMLPLTYMDPHQIQASIGDVGTYGIRAVGIDSILNISSNTMPRRLDIVPPDPDIAAVTLVHADYFEMEQRVSDGVTIFPDRSNIMLTVEMIERTDHPLKSIAVDFQINGEGDWKPIAMLTGDDIAEVASGLEVNWDRTDDFADLLDMRGQAMVRVTVTNALDVEGESTATFEIVPLTLRLGGLSIDTSHADDYYGYLSLEAIKKNPELLQLIPSGILHLDLSQNLLSELPSGFNPTPEPTDDITQMFDIDQKNFGNGITPRPAWHVLAGSSPPDPGRWLNGNQLNLYVVTVPTSSIQNVTFNLTGPQSATMEAVSVPADGYMHNFQLEEERAILFLPSWPSLNANTPIFSGVTLMIDGQDPISMTSKLVGDEVVWEAPATLTANSTVYYYYQVELDQPYQLDDEIVSSWPMPDPRNLQVENRGIVETLLAPDVLELKEIVTTTDLKLRSVFNVPGIGEYESLWVAAFDFPADADGAYSVDTVVQYMGGPIRSIPNQMFTLDRTPPTADITVAIGESAGLYEGPDGYVTAAHTDEGTLNLTAMPTAAPSESAAYLYQIIQLDDAGNPGNHVWNPAMVTGEMLPLTYMDPHQIQASIGDVGTYGIRAVGIDSILNISSNTMPRRLDIVPPDPDIAAVTLVHADYNGDGTTDGRFEMEQSADGATIFSDRSNVNLTVEMIDRTDHPLKSIAIDFQINGEGGWKPIAMLTGDGIADTESGLHVNWNRTDDFADLLDIRGQAMVRVTVTNALDVEGESTTTFELVPPALQLGGLSINPDYTAFQDSRLQELLGMDLGGLAAASANVGDPAGNLLVMLPPSLFLIISPLLSVLGSMVLELPSGFEPADENVIQESFGNAITSRPSSWFAMAGDARDPGRWITGDQLNLYTVAGPTATGVTFTVDGSQPIAAVSVPADGGFMYTFQLEEELIALFIGNMPVFGAVQLMIDGQAPIDMVRGDMGVWSADAALTPGSTVSYYYMIELAAPYHDPMGGFTIAKFPLVDPRNRQVKTTGLLAALDSIASSEFGLDTLDSGVRSVFTVPEVYESQSLWVGRLDFAADGAYSLDVAVQYESGATDALTDKMFTVDRTPPTADVTLTPDAPGENAGMYLRDDGVYIATALPVEGAASLNLAAIPIDDSDLMAYMYELARLDAAGNPGAWNPAITADLLPLDLLKFLTNPGSVLPVTYDPPHQIEMLIRNSEGGQLMGRYGFRAVGIDSLLNMDSGRGPGVVVDIVLPDPDRTMISSVQADFDGNGVIEGFEMQSTAGDVVVFSDSMATLTVDVIERTMHPLTSIAVEFQMPGGDWETIAMMDAAMLAFTMAGDQLMVNWAVPDLAGLPDRGGHVMVRTVTTNALSIVDESVGYLAYQRRTAPEVSAIYTYVTERHPDSGAPQGMITVSVFTQVMTAPDAAAVQLEIRRYADADWMPLGVAQIGDSRVTSHVQIAIIEDLVNSILSGSPTAPISPLYREWFLDVDSATLEDTILDDTPAASDASLDDNPYVVRAIAVDMAGGVYPSADGITDSISLDNYSPTAINQVANEVEMVAPREDGSYYVSGLLAEGVPDPMLTLTARTGAHPNAFMGGLKLAINDAAGEAVAIDETAFTDSGNYTFKGVFKLASIPNGTYTFMVVGHTADGSPEERIVAMSITVEVGNFTPPDNFADPSVDILSITNTRGDANSPSDIDAMYPIGFPAIGDKVTATLIVPNVSTGDVDVLIGDDGMSASAMGALMVMTMPDTNSLVIMIDASGLDEGMYSLVGTVTKPNGSVQFGLPSIRVDRSAPVIEIVSPLAGHQVTSLPTIQVSYTDATGFDPETNPMPVEIVLTRLTSTQEIDVNESMIRMMAAEGEVLTQTGNIVYTHDDPLAGGAYRIGVSVTDALGNTATAEPVEVTSGGVAPMVTIITPASGQVVDPDQPLVVSAALSGSGEITVTRFKLNSAVLEATAKDNWLTYTMEPPLAGKFLKRGSGNTVTIEIVDAEGNTAEATSTFALAFDKTPPVVAAYSPQGIIRTDRPIAAATVTDESGINTRSLTIIIAGVPGNQGTGRRSSPTSTTVTFTPSISVTPGPYTARVTVEDVNGNRTEVEWQFTVELDVTPPAITTISPQGVVRSDKPIISVSASDDMSGVDTIEIGVKGEGNRTVEGLTSTRSDRTSATFTPTAALTSGVYTVDVKLADMSGNKASGQWQFTVELDTIPPSIVITRPAQEHTENRRPTISATYTDNLSGVDADSVTLSLDGTTVTPDAVSETQVTFTSPFDLTFGQHTVTLEVSDMASTPNTATQEWSFFVERVGIADARNYPNPFEDGTTITFRLSRQASVTVRIYDFTGRLVAQPIINSLREAGSVEIAWSGDTSAGENLARGVYFCHILMESELEPQSAILKMAIISE